VWAFDQFLQVVQTAFASADFEKSSDHPANLITEESLTHKIEIEAITTLVEPDPKQGANGRSCFWVGHRK
jgi:hypothetical protein